MPVFVHRNVLLSVKWLKHNNLRRRRLDVKNGCRNNQRIEWSFLNDPVIRGLIYQREKGSFQGLIWERMFQSRGGVWGKNGGYLLLFLFPAVTGLPLTTPALSMCKNCPFLNEICRIRWFVDEVAKLPVIFCSRTNSLMRSFAVLFTPLLDMFFRIFLYLFMISARTLFLVVLHCFKTFALSLRFIISLILLKNWRPCALRLVLPLAVVFVLELDCDLHAAIGYITKNNAKEMTTCMNARIHYLQLRVFLVTRAVCSFESTYLDENKGCFPLIRFSYARTRMWKSFYLLSLKILSI